MSFIKQFTNVIFLRVKRHSKSVFHFVFIALESERSLHCVVVVFGRFLFLLLALVRCCSLFSLLLILSLSLLRRKCSCLSRFIYYGLIVHLVRSLPVVGVFGIWKTENRNREKKKNNKKRRRALSLSRLGV